jgi:hypothetical protein
MEHWDAAVIQIIRYTGTPAHGGHYATHRTDGKAPGLPMMLSEINVHMKEPKLPENAVPWLCRQQSRITAEQVAHAPNAHGWVQWEWCLSCAPRHLRRRHHRP